MLKELPTLSPTSRDYLMFDREEDSRRRLRLRISNLARRCAVVSDRRPGIDPKPCGKFRI